jgi:hypothetical protein
VHLPPFGCLPRHLSFRYVAVCRLFVCVSGVPVCGLSKAHVSSAEEMTDMWTGPKARFTHQSFPRSSSLRWRTSPYHTYSHVLTYLRKTGRAYHSTARKTMSTRICETVPLRSRRDLRWPRERTSSQRGRRQVCMRSIHLGFPNLKYDAAASLPEEMTDVWTRPSSRNLPHERPSHS